MYVSEFHHFQQIVVLVGKDNRTMFMIISIASIDDFATEAKIPNSHGFPGVFHQFWKPMWVSQWWSA
jgi:hypothetical protein